MDNQLKSELESIIFSYEINVIEGYTDTALMINASSVSQRRYNENKDIQELSTIAGIPNLYRFPTDIDRRIGREQLVVKYGDDIPRKIAENYIVTTVSTIDAFVEDLYECLLLKYSMVDSDRVSKLLQSPWANDRIVNYFIDDLGLGSSHKEHQLSDFFDIYRIWRTIRHALMHTKGALTDKHVGIITEIESKHPQQPSILTSPIIDGRKVILGVDAICMMRFWALSFISHMLLSFQDTFPEEPTHQG